MPEPQACNFIKKETLAQVFSCKFCENSKNTFFTEHIWATASVNYQCWSNAVEVCSCRKCYFGREKFVSRKWGIDKTGMTVTLAESISGKVLPNHIQSKTKTSFPVVEFSSGFVLAYNEKTLRQWKENSKFDPKHRMSIHQRCEKMLGIDISQKYLHLCDAFKTQQI